MKISSMFIWETVPISAASSYTSPDIRDNYTPELISTVQSLITLDYIQRNDAAKIMLKPHQVGIEETGE